MINTVSSESNPINWKKRLIFFLIMTAGITAALFIFTEILLRIAPNRWSHPHFGHQKDPVLGWKNPADYRFISHNRKQASMNNYGMRNGQVQMEKSGRYRIAVLGDSFTAATQVADHEVFTSMIQEACAGVEVLNFGVSGYGTTQEFIQYQRLVNKFSPDLVIVMFWGFNDPVDNSLELTRHIHNPVARPFYIYGQDGQLQLRAFTLAPEPGRIIAFKIWLVRTFVTFNMIYESKREFTSYLKKLKKRKKIKNKKKAVNVDIDTHVPASKAQEVTVKRLKDLMWKRAWRITGLVFKEFADEVRTHNAQFMIAALPIEDVEYKDIPADSLTEVDTRVRDIAKDIDSWFLPMTTCYRRYLQENNVNPPNFHFKDNGHFRPLGHVVAARCLIGFLEKRTPISGCKKIDSENKYR